MGWYENWVAKNSPTSVGLGNIGNGYEGYNGLDTATVDDLKDKDFGIDAQLTYDTGFSGINDSTLADINDKDFGIEAQLEYDGLGQVTPEASGLSPMDYLNTNAKGIGTGIQAIGLGASLYDSFWGDSAKMNKKNMQLLDQQIASNADTIANTKAVRKAWADTERTV